MPLNIDAFLNTVASRLRSLPVVILYVTEECNLKCATCSYRRALPGELSLAEIRQLAAKLQLFGLRHIAFSGGEPLTRRDLPHICDIFRQYRVKQTLLTNGVLLEKRLPEIESYLSEIVVSLDGADAATHDAIRGARSFDRILSGIRRAVKEAKSARVSLRAVVQRRNFRQLPAMVGLARSLGVHHISFLAADVITDAFGRSDGAQAAEPSAVLLDADEAGEFRGLLDEMAATHAGEFRTGFIAQSPAAMYHIADYYAAMRGLCSFPPTLCNAPMVSAVITSTGAFKPCFFLPPLGNIRSAEIEQIANSAPARQTRKDVKARTMNI